MGLGYVGTVAAAGLSDAGHEVVGIDVDRRRVDALAAGRVPMFEPGLEAKVSRSLRCGSLRFLHRDDFAETPGDAALVATGTPPTHGGAADLRQVRAAVDWLKSVGSDGLVVVMKSTVPPGTGRRLLDFELKGTGIRYTANPEFLREGRAVEDWASPERIVVGVEPGDDAAADVVRRMHAGIDAPHLVTDITSAEMIKYASNAFLATRISFINEIASLCGSIGASIDDVSMGLAMDSRTGARIHAGVGYGGSCFPKDVRALDHLALTSGVEVDLLRSVINTNNRQRLLPLHALRQRFGGALAGLRVGVLGLAFKPETDDVRDAPSLDLVRALVDEGVRRSGVRPARHGQRPRRAPLRGAACRWRRRGREPRPGAGAAHRVARDSRVRLARRGALHDSAAPRLRRTQRPPPRRARVPRLRIRRRRPLTPFPLDGGRLEPALSLPKGWG